MIIRPLRASDRKQWDPLWQGYLQFNETSLTAERTELAWGRFFEDNHVFQATVAEIDGDVVGIAHAMMRPSTWELVGQMFLEDLFVAKLARGQGVARALITYVKEQAVTQGAESLYWQTREGNLAARALYDSMAKRNDYIQYVIKL